MAKPRPITMTNELRYKFQIGYYSLDDKELCWLWKGTLFNKGYGSLEADGRTYRASRISYMLANNLDYLEGGDENLILHSCDNPPCVNPNHLRLGTHEDNAKQKVAEGRANLLFGENHQNAKLTNEMIDAIHDRYWRYGESQHVIAEQFDVSQSLVSRILNGKLRKRG